MRFCNGRTFSQLNQQVIIQTDASLKGWGAVCNGVQISGQWSEEERSLYINVLELLAIKLALFSFSRGKRVKAIHFQIENKAALSYLLKMEGKKNENMIRLSKEIWHYLLNHNKAITAEYLPSVLNYLRCYFQGLFTSISVVAAMLPIMERPNAILMSEFVNI